MTQLPPPPPSTASTAPGPRPTFRPHRTAEGGAPYGIEYLPLDAQPPEPAPVVGISSPAAPRGVGANGYLPSPTAGERGAWLVDSPRSTPVAYLLLLLVGIFGIHQLYLRRPWWFLAYALTAGFLLIGPLVDLVTLPVQVRRANERWARRAGGAVG